MKAIDFKSVVIGLLIGVCAMLVIGAFRNPVGRWQFEGHTRIDTKTGALYVTEGHPQNIDTMAHAYVPPPDPTLKLTNMAGEVMERYN